MGSKVREQPGTELSSAGTEKKLKALLFLSITCPLGAPESPSMDWNLNGAHKENSLMTDFTECLVTGTMQGLAS